MSSTKTKAFFLKLSPLALAFSCALTLPNAAQATNYVVNAITENDDDESTTLNEALYLAKNSSEFDDTITFNSSVLEAIHDLGVHSFDFSVSGNLSLIGPAEGAVTLNTLYSDDSQGDVLSMSGGDFTLTNIEIIANETEPRDGTILLIEDGSLTLNNVLIHGKINKSNAGFRQGIHASNSDVSLTASTLKALHAPGEGSAVHFSDNAASKSLTLLNSTFSKNGKEGNTDDSSALYVYSYYAQTIVDINATTFEKNNFYGASGKAAAITLHSEFYSYLDVDITGATFDKNESAESYASAALSVTGAAFSATDLAILNSTFTENIAKHAGAINLQFEQGENVSININGSTFRDNVGENAASVLDVAMDAYAANLILAINNTNIRSNGDKELSARGVMHVDLSGDARDLSIDIRNSQINNNRVIGQENEAAALTVFSSGGYDTSLLIQNSTFSGNKSAHKDSTGAVALVSSDISGGHSFEIDIQGSTFDNNLAGAVGVLAVTARDFYDAGIFIANSTITGNGADSDPLSSAIKIVSNNNTNAYFDMVHATLVENLSIGSSASSSALHLFASETPLNVLIANSILSSNSHAVDEDAVDFESKLRDLTLENDLVLVDVQYSLFGTAVAAGDAVLDEQLTIQKNSLQEVNPELGELALNGGTTETRCLLSYSPALNAAGKSISKDFELQNDQAGVDRLEDKEPDMGAVEYSQACEEADVGLGTFTRESSGGLFGAFDLHLFFVMFVVLGFRVKKFFQNMT